MATLTRSVRDRTHDTSPPAVIDFHSDGPSNRTGSIMGGVLNRVGTVVVHIWYYSASKSFGIRTSMPPDLVQLMHVA